jgi:two-component system cell cycle sensor histidine kinase/response regulator CckA
MPNSTSITTKEEQDSDRGFVERLIRRIAFHYSRPSLDGLTYWRERILAAVLSTGTGMLLMAIIPAFYLALTRQLWTLLAADGMAVFLTVYLLLISRRPFQFRAVATLLCTFSVGVVIIHQIGFLSGGPTWLFCFSVLSGVLLGLRAAVTATILNAAALVTLGGLFNPGHPIEQVFLHSLLRSLTAWANFIFLNLVSAASVATLVNGLLSLNRKTEQATAELKREREALIQVKDKLKQEIAVRRDSEKTLKERERLYRTLAENIRDVIWTMDLNLRFTYVSPSAQAVQGWTPEEYRDLRLEDIIAPNSLRKVYGEFEKQMNLGAQTGSFTRSTMLEVELLRKDGLTVWAEVTASFLLGDDGKPLGILGVTRDITERRKSDSEKEVLLETLNRSRKMEAIGRLAGGVAHDLNNVLSGIVSYPDLLLMDLPEKSPMRRPIETIQESGKKAAAIVQDLLTLARRGVPVSEIVYLNEVIRNYFSSPEFQRLRTFHPGVEVIQRLDPDLLQVIGSPIHLFKTIMNLVSNAAEAMPEDGRVTVTTENVYLDRPIVGYAEIQEGEYVVFRVVDTGVGIPEEDLQRIFEPFYTKKKMGRSGTGLGMAVVWGTVEDHQGYIEVRSTYGEGTTVTVYLPGTRQTRAVKASHLRLDQYRGHGETVLVVDDIQEQREIAGRILEQLSYVPRVAASGEEAVEFLRKERADLVILDMIMDPGIDGLETYRRILQIHPGQRAIIASGFAETDRVRIMQELGAGSYIRKPYTVETLGVAIRSELASGGRHLNK